jgi:hypothetical protein
LRETFEVGMGFEGGYEAFVLLGACLEESRVDGLGFGEDHAALRYPFLALGGVLGEELVGGGEVFADLGGLVVDVLAGGILDGAAFQILDRPGADFLRGGNSVFELLGVLHIGERVARGGRDLDGNGGVEFGSQLADLALESLGAFFSLAALGRDFVDALEELLGDGVFFLFGLGGVFVLFGLGVAVVVSFFVGIL